jgi:hypothetical protein
MSSACSPLVSVLRQFNPAQNFIPYSLMFTFSSTPLPPFFFFLWMGQD